MFLKGWPFYYAKVVDLSNELCQALIECKGICKDIDKRKILASSISCVGTALCQCAYDIRKDVEDEEKKSLS